MEPLSRSRHIQEIERLQARVAALTAALRRYGYHDSGCDLQGPMCSCGFDAAVGGT